mgnify:CR=1 FL=1
MAKLIKCKACGASISKNAKACPQCAEPIPKSVGVGGLLVLLVFGLFMYNLINPEKPANTKPALPTAKAEIETKTKQLVTELKTIPASEVEKNQDRYAQLVKMNPGNEKFKLKLALYDQKLKRQKTIEDQFSGWSGSHIQLEKHIRKSLKNPDSYDHVKTVYYDKGNHIIIKTTYRGTNSFGAIVTNSAMAKASIDGSDITLL